MSGDGTGRPAPPSRKTDSMTDAPTPSDLIRDADARGARGDWAGALTALQTVPLDERNAVALTRRRMIAADRAGDLSGLAGAGRSLADSGLTFPDQDREGFARTLLNRSAKAFQRDDLAAAIACAEAATALEPDNLLALRNLWKFRMRSGDSHGADAADAEIHRVVEARAARHPLAATGLRFFDPNWMISRIGEMVQQLDTFAKAQRLGWLPPMHCILLAPPAHVANMAMLDYWRPHVPVVSDERLVRAMRPLAEELGFDPVRFALDGRPAIHKVPAHKLVQRQWEAEGRAPLLSLTHRHHCDGWRRLTRFGMREEDWFVCLHSRESGYLGEEKAGLPNHNSYRNTDIGTFIPAAREIVARGGWVIRVGDPSMRPLPPHERMIDYALDDDVRCDWMDMFLCAENRFFLGTGSGLVLVATAFGKPVIMTNMTPMSHTSFSGYDIFLPKLFRRRADGRILDLESSLSPPLRDLVHGDQIAAFGYEVVDNTPDDIRDATLEMIERLEGRDAGETPDEERQRQLRRLFDRTGNVMQGRMGRGFLRRHAQLLPA